MKILYAGESWLGSCARSFKEALVRRGDILLDEINDDLFIPKHRPFFLRGVARALHPIYKKNLYNHVLNKIKTNKPDFFIAYKGFPYSADFIDELKGRGVYTVNIYPDCSPNAYGREHLLSVSKYNQVVTTKPFHIPVWKRVYGLLNPCFFIPQGYDPFLHLNSNPICDAKFDVVMAATWRPEYDLLMRELCDLLYGTEVKVGIAGAGWAYHKKNYPSNWQFSGELSGHSYINWVRSGKICIAPVTRVVNINSRKQPGDEDTTRTYELAAANCFFIHRRTDYVKNIYNEYDELPMFDDAHELADKILYYLDKPVERRRIASNAHRRAVPNYSLDCRASALIELLNKVI